MSTPRDNVTPAELQRLRGHTVLITGAGGMLGSAFHRILQEAVPGCRVLAYDRQALDVTERRAVLAIAPERPTLILHCASDVNADRCERHPAECRAVQVDGTEHVIELARLSGARVVYPQSVFIFDGTELPVSEHTEPAPLSVYGRYKLEAERRLLDALPDALVVRMAGFFGGDGRDKNFVGTFTRGLFYRLSRGERLCLVGERVWQPSYTMDLAANTLLLVARELKGIYHMGAHGEASFHDVARACVDDLGLAQVMAVARVPREALQGVEVAPRPYRIVTANHRLACEGLDRQRHWRVALREYLSRPFFQERARTALQALA